jgi:hypothetical protein
MQKIFVVSLIVFSHKLWGMWFSLSFYL